MDNLTPTNRGEQFLDNILRTLSDENVEVELVAGNDDEKFLDDILKAAGGDEPLYNLTERWRHQWWLRKIAEAIASGGGGSNWELLATKEFDVTTTSTSETSVGTVTLPERRYDKNSTFFVQVIDKAGNRNGYFYASQSLYSPTTSSTSYLSLTAPVSYSYKGSSVSKNARGVYPTTISGRDVAIKARYGSDYGTIDGTYVASVYLLTLPEDLILF